MTHRTRARAGLPAFTLVATALVAACSGGNDGSGANGGNGASNGAGGTPILFGSGSTTGSSAAGSSAAGGPGFEVCTGLAVQGEQVALAGPLDIYLVFDRTASMGQDCDFTPGTTPPVASKACFATYAIAEYVMSAKAADDTHLAFQFMSLSNNDCNGTPYATPLVAMTPLPVSANHAIVQAISNENFAGGIGTHIEGAFRGIASFTATHDQTVARPAGRTTIGILMTDGDPNGCDENVGNLAKIVSDHLAASGVKTFIIGETGATLANLERYASSGGAAPHSDFCGNGPTPCHYWDVGDGKPAALASALASIVGQATVAHPVPCTYKVPAPPAGQTLDPTLVNVSFKDGNGSANGVYKVDSKAKCDAKLGGWYYDSLAAPSEILLCEATCSAVTTAKDANVSVEFGCASRSGPVR
jgi:hypothetical protein